MFTNIQVCELQQILMKIYPKDSKTYTSSVMETLTNLSQLHKDVYAYEHMDEWERFNETSLPMKKEIYSNL